MIEIEDQQAVVYAPRELRRQTRRDFRRAIDLAHMLGAERVVVDFAAVEFCDPDVLPMLTQLAREGRPVITRNVTPAVRACLEQSAIPIPEPRTCASVRAVEPPHLGPFWLRSPG